MSDMNDTIDADVRPTRRVEVDGAGDDARSPPLCFLDLVGYTALTEERGDEAAAELAAHLAELVAGAANAHPGSAVKWLGDGLMANFRDPKDAVAFALEIVRGIPTAGLPPVRIGVAAGPVVVYSGDYFGRTVNLAARIAARAAPGEVLVSESVVVSLIPRPATFVDAGAARLKGFTRPIQLFEPVKVGSR